MMTRHESSAVPEGLPSAIGNTPLTRLSGIFGPESAIFLKMESMNPGGSAKDRSALAVVKHAIETGRVTSSGTLVESSSGNMGIALAQVCASYGIRFICVFDERTPRRTVETLSALGAELDYVSGDRQKLQLIRIERVRAILESNRGFYWPNQYANPLCARAQRSIVREICSQLGKAPDALFCSISTCGTIRGCVEYASDHDLGTEIIAVDAVGSNIFPGGEGERLFPGHGGTMLPPLGTGLDLSPIRVFDWECVVACRAIAACEGLLVGPSTGANMAALLKMRWPRSEGRIVVLVAHDRGDRYIDTVFSDLWVEERLGNLPDFENAFLGSDRGSRY